MRRSQSSQHCLNNRNTSSNTENSSCLDSLNLYLLLTYGTCLLTGAADGAAAQFESGHLPCSVRTQLLSKWSSLQPFSAVKAVICSVPEQAIPFYFLLERVVDPTVGTQKHWPFLIKKKNEVSNIPLKISDGIPPKKYKIK